MHISALYTYPVKSCAGLSHGQIELDQRGPVWDRRWMVVNGEGMFLTQRELPRMALVQPAFKGDNLSLTAPGMREACLPLEPDRIVECRVQVWQDVCKAWDEGDEVAGWLSHFLEMHVRLVRIADDWVRPVDPRYAHQPSQTGFPDGFPLLIVSEASLDALNERLAERGSDPLPMSRFRPNIVIAGSEAFAEDHWQTVKIGGIRVDVVKPCARCAITTVDQQTGSVPDSAEPLATLNTFRKQNGKVMFAQNAIHRMPGALHVGDIIEVKG